MAKRRKETRVRMLVLRALFLAVFCVAAVMLGRALLADRQEQSTFKELAAIKAQSAANMPQPSEEAISSPEQSGQETAPLETPKPSPLPQYAELCKMNRDFFGWLTIEDIDVDFPVMYAPDRREYYLNRDFYGEYSHVGTPFIDENCPPDGNFYLIYGHHIEDIRVKSMFGKLFRYDDPAYWEQHPTFRFDTAYEEREYEVMAVFYSRIYYVEEKDVFRYYEYTDLCDEAVFNDYVRQVKEAERYDTGVTASYGDELIALSTCSYHDVNGRFVVVARRIK